MPNAQKKIFVHDCDNTRSEWTHTGEIRLPSDAFGHIIGQDHVVEAVRLAARQRRFLMLIGEPGTGKSLIAKAMGEYVAVTHQQEVLAVANPQAAFNPRIRVLPAGEGKREIDRARLQQSQKKRTLNFLWWMVLTSVGIVGFVLSSLHYWNYFFLTVIAAGLLLVFRKNFLGFPWEDSPVILVRRDGRDRVCFVDATGFSTGALLGDVRHDPFQSGGRETPPHMLLVPGAIHLAHGGILFIDEMGTLSRETQQQLLTAIQEKQFPIMGRLAGSSGSMVRSDPVPCDFLLCLAGNQEDMRRLHPALRSRMEGFGYVKMTRSTMPDTKDNREKLAQFVAQEVVKDGKIAHFSRAAVEAVIDKARSMAGHQGQLSLRLRELSGLIRVAGDVAHVEGAVYVEPRHVQKALEIREGI